MWKEMRIDGNVNTERNVSAFFLIEWRNRPFQLRQNGQPDFLVL